MQLILFVTTNQIKFRKAQENLLPFGIELEQANFEMEELQTEDAQKLIEHKAKQAFEYFKQPLLVNDDFWSIPELQGFPGPYMKYCNTHLRAADWLRLTAPLKHKVVDLIAHYGFHNAQKVTVTSITERLQICDQAAGTVSNTSFLSLVKRQDDQLTIAQHIEQGLPIHPSSDGSEWKELAELLR